METDFKNISGIYRANTDIINKAIADVRPEDWFRKPGDDSNHLPTNCKTRFDRSRRLLK